MCEMRGELKCHWGVRVPQLVVQQNHAKIGSCGCRSRIDSGTHLRVVSSGCVRMASHSGTWRKSRCHRMLQFLVASLLLVAMPFVPSSVLAPN